MNQAPTTPQLLQDPARVRRSRVTAGLQQNELAELVGISAAHMCRIELGRASASERVLARLAGVLQCEIDDLLPGDCTCGANHGRQA